MSGQLSFLEEEEPARDKLFFAILPDADAAERIADLARSLAGEHGLKGKPVTTDHLHITLNYLGHHVGVPADFVAKASKAAASLTMKPFYVPFDRVMSFKRTRGAPPLVLCGEDGLDALLLFRHNLAMALAAALPRLSKLSFTPHVTLLYDYKLLVEQRVEVIGWTVREFVLIHKNENERPYNLIGRWQLG